MANAPFGISWGDWVAIAGFATGIMGYATARFHATAKSDARNVIKEEYSKLTEAITNLNQTVMKLGLQLDQALKTQHEQSKALERQDGRLDDHEVRLARLEEHQKGEEQWN